MILYTKYGEKNGMCVLYEYARNIGCAFIKEKESNVKNKMTDCSRIRKEKE